MFKIIKRNKFTILLGLILSVVFVVIIILSQSKENNFSLTPAKRNETFEVETEPSQNSQTPTETGESNIPTSNQPTDNTEDLNLPTPKEVVDEKVANMEPIRIRFSEEKGFIPNDYTAIEDQTLIWENNTDRTIKITETIEKYTDLPEVVEIGAGQSYSLQLTEPKKWGYKELESGRVGTIYIYAKK